MENPQRVNLRYELLLTRFQGIKPSSHQDLLYKTLQCIAWRDAPAAAALVSPVTEVENSQFASVITFYEQECRRVALFYRSQHQQLWNALLEVVGLLRLKADSILDPACLEAPHGLEKLDMIRGALDALGEKAVALDSFAKLNVEAAAELALFVDGKKKSSNTPARRVLATYNKETVQSAFREYSTAAEAALLGALRLDSIILGLSDAYALLRLVKHAEAEGIAPVSIHSSSFSSLARWVAPQKYKRTTRKFWLKLSDVALFKTQVIKQLPILVYGKNRRKITEVDPLDLPFAAPTANESDASPITSVYLDSLLAGLPSYHTRLRRRDGATAVRLRWYGERNAEDPSQEIFVEKKVHVVGDNMTILNNNRLATTSNKRDDKTQQQQQGRQEGHTESEKQRISLPQSEIPALLSGQPVAVPHYFSKEDYDFLQQVQMYIMEDSHVPVLRTCYNRTAFQCEDHNRVRISMDTDLRMVRDYIPGIHHNTGADGGSGLIDQRWCRDDIMDINNDAPSRLDRIHFPYAIVEVKLQVNPPKWLQNLVRQNILLPVPKFSKFLHGSALLYQHYVANVPYWFLPNSSSSNQTLNPNNSNVAADENDELLMTPATWEEMVGPSAEAVSDAAAWLFPPTTGVDGSFRINEADRKKTEETEFRVTQVKPGLLWRWKRGKQNHPSPSTPTSEAPLNNILPTAAAISIFNPATSVTAVTSGALSHDDPINHSAPSTPNGASPRAEVILHPSTIQQGQMMHQTIMMLNTDSSGRSSISYLTSGQQQRFTSTSSPTSSASVSLLVSSAEGNSTLSNASNDGGGDVHGNHHDPLSDEKKTHQQQQKQQQRQSSQTYCLPWQVFQEPPSSPRAKSSADEASGSGAGSICGSAGRDIEGRYTADGGESSSSFGISISSMSGVTTNEADVESGEGGVHTSGHQGALPPAGLVDAGGATSAALPVEKNPASRKSSLVHFVSLIPGFGGSSISSNKTNNNKNDESAAAAAAPTATVVERKTTTNSTTTTNTSTTTNGSMYHPALAFAAEDKNKKQDSPCLLPSFSSISSPSSSFPIDSRNDPLRGSRNGGILSGTISGSPPRAMVRTRVEPKTFFANERTFLQWLQISVLVMFLGLNLLK